MNPTTTITTIECPLPELADALQPYIRSREEVANIRNVVDQVLNKHHGDPERPITRLTTFAGDKSLTEEATPLGGSGIRSAYGKALIAHQSAQNKLEALRAELSRLHLNNGEAYRQQQRQTGGHVDGTLDAIAAIRQEQRRRKLQIIERGVNALETEREQSQCGDISNILGNEKQTLPLPPSKPAVTLDGISRKGVASEIARLRKAVLQAQSSVNIDTATLKNEPLPNLGDGVHGDPKILALTHTRDSMVMWLENQLAKIPETNYLHTDTITVDSTDDDKVSEQHVRDAYLGYIEARKALVRIIGAINNNERIAATTAAGSATSTSPQKQTPATAPAQRQIQHPSANLATTILPYARELCEIIEREAALMQESTFVRRQVAWTSERTRQLVHRLADESHLVAPGAEDVRAWARAAREARESDAEIVGAKLAAGEESFLRAREAAL